MKLMLCVLTLVFGAPLHAKVTYFATVYLTGDQAHDEDDSTDDAGRVLGSHFFGSFVAKDNEKVIEEFDISMMPKRPLENGWKRGTFLRAARGIIPAMNMSVKDTLELTKSEGKKLRDKQTFQIPKSQFELNRNIHNGIKSGELRYRFVDLAGRGRAMNCRTAIAGPDFRGGLEVNSIEPLKEHMQSREED